MQEGREAHVLVFTSYLEKCIDMWDERRAVVQNDLGSEEKGLNGGKIHDPA